MGELGELLRTTREAKGLSLSQAEQGTRIRSTYLQAIENEEFDQLPHPAYIKGFIHNYAVFLGLDPKQLPELHHGPPREETALPQYVVNQPLLHARSAWWKWLLPVAALAALAVVGVWAFQSYGGLPWRVPLPTPPAATATLTIAEPSPSPSPQPSATAAATVGPTPEPSPQPTSTEAPPPATSGLTVAVEIVQQRAWLEVWVDGQRVLATNLEPNAKSYWIAAERVILRTGNAGAVRVTANDQDMGTMGSFGQVAELEWTAAGVPTRTPTPR